ncbi:hypothetical protein B0H11DRAFT_481875 [Mycena galericulata]|nr:hypothetical protein B0H11DRAFT_481875 [Mycena galericulata]
MADESEVLDWDEDDAQHPLAATEHDEDAISLGPSDDEQDELEADPVPDSQLTEQTPEPPTAEPELEPSPSKRPSPPPRHARTRGERDRDRDRDRERDRERHRDGRDSREDREGPRKHQKLTVAPPITHALPPKPVTTVPAFMHPSHPSSIEATLMAPSSLKEGKDGKPKSSTAPSDGVSRLSS